MKTPSWYSPALIAAGITFEQDGFWWLFVNLRKVRACAHCEAELRPSTFVFMRRTGAAVYRCQPCGRELRLETQLQQVRTLAAIAAVGLRVADEKQRDAPCSADEHRAEAAHALRLIVPDPDAWWDAHPEVGRLRGEMYAERVVGIVR